MAMSNAERQKKFRERRSIRLGKLYIARDWEALGTKPSEWNLSQCAVRKLWCIYYGRRAAGVYPLRKPRQPSKPKLNTCLFKHL